VDGILLESRQDVENGGQRNQATLATPSSSDGPKRRSNHWTAVGWSKIQS